MQAIHSTLLESSAVHHAVFLPHLTPSTIYPFPQPRRGAGLTDSALEIKVVGNVVVAGGSDLRVFEVRGEPMLLGGARDERRNGEIKRENGEDQLMTDDMEDEDGFKSMGNVTTQASEIVPTRLGLHLLCKHTVHGTITGLAGIRTMASVEDGLDRLLVSMKDAKISMLEWSRGDLSTVSLHTYERCPQVMLGDLKGFTGILRSDPSSRLAALLLPSDALAMLPIVQDLTEADLLEAGYARDVPYTPSFVLPLSDFSESIRNVKDFCFLPGFNSPTICLLYCSVPTYVGRFQTERDAFQLEIRTLDLTSKTYASLTTVRGLPSDALYVVACPAHIGGVLVVAETSVWHVDQGGNVVGCSVNGWFTKMSGRAGADRSLETLQLELDDSEIAFLIASGAETVSSSGLLVTKDGAAHEIVLHVEGRGVARVEIRPQMQASMPTPSAVVGITGYGAFIGCAVGDSVLAGTRHEDMAEEDDVEQQEETKAPSLMEVDVDLEDLYGESMANGADAAQNKTKRASATRLELVIDDTLVGMGAITDMTFGSDSADTPELVVLGGGAGPTVVNVFKPGMPLRDRKRLGDLDGSQGLWSLAVKRATDRIRSDPVETVIIASDMIETTTVYSVTEDDFLEELGQLEVKTIEAAAFLANDCFVHVTPNKIALYEADSTSVAEIQQDGSPIVSASISDPFIGVIKADNTFAFFRGDLQRRTLVHVEMSGPGVPYAACSIFSDRSGIFRTFEATSAGDGVTARPTKIIRTGKSSARPQIQLTDDQLQRLQAARPTISDYAEDGMEFAVDANRGLQWLSLLSQTGTLEIKLLPSLDTVFRSRGLSDSANSLVDEGDEQMASESAAPDDIDAFALADIGTKNPRPHLVIAHVSGRLVVYEAQTRFTLDSADVATRRSLAVRFRKVLTHWIPRPKLARRLVPFSVDAELSGITLTGSSPVWCFAADSQSIRAVTASESLYCISPRATADREPSVLMSVAAGCGVKTLQRQDITGPAWPCKRIRLERTYTHVTLDPPKGMYVLASAISAPYQIYNDECEIIPSPEVPNGTRPLMERSTLELFDRETWTPMDGYEFDENEVVLCMQDMLLEATSDPSGVKHFLVAGTSVNRGEDMSTKGNTYVFEVIPVVPGDGSGNVVPLPPRLRLVVKEEGTAPVTALANLNGYVVQAMGQKVFVQAFDLEERLVAVAFLDVAVYVTSLAIFKNLVLIGDQVKSLWFAAFQESPYKLELLGRDFQDATTATCHFLSSDGKIAFVTHDDEGIVRMLEYDPEHVASRDGERLMRRTEFNVGSEASRTIAVARRKAGALPQVQLVTATGDGALHTMVASKPARFKRLQLLQGQMTRSVQHVAGANPRAFRTVANDLYARPLAKGILDGQLLANFVDLPESRQNELVEPIGTDRETVLNDIVELGGLW